MLNDAKYRTHCADASVDADPNACCLPETWRRDARRREGDIRLTLVGLLTLYVISVLVGVCL
jgi:hypothetical protein